MRRFVITMCLVLLAFPHSGQAGDWPTYGGGAQRLNYNASETILSARTVANLKLHWRVSLPSKSNTQPLLVPLVTTTNGAHDEIYATTETGWVYALNATTGAVDWSVSTPLSPGCRNQKTFGIFGTPTIDEAANLLYVVDGTGGLHALDIRTGAESAGYPVELIDTANQNVTYNRSSPTLAGGFLYVTTGGHCESPDVPYHGQVIKFDPVGKVVVARFFPVGNGLTVLGAGIWGPGGVSAEADGSFLYAATGNALRAVETTPHAEQVVQLDPDLNLMSAAGPTLAPNGDFDFGTTPLLIDAPGCAPLVAAINKTGIMVVYQRFGIAVGATQILSISAGGTSSPFFGMPSYDPVLHTVYVNNPVAAPDGSFVKGLDALQLTANCTLTSLWQTPLDREVIPHASDATAPVLANGVAYVTTGGGEQLIAADERSGAILWSSGLSIHGPTMFSPMVANGQVFVQGGQVLYAFGL